MRRLGKITITQQAPQSAIDLCNELGRACNGKSFSDIRIAVALLASRFIILDPAVENHAQAHRAATELLDNIEKNVKVNWDKKRQKLITLS